MLQQLLYSLSHPNDYAGLWSLDLSIITLLVVFFQLRVMLNQSRMMKQQNEIVIAQDKTNREILGRRVKLRMFGVNGPNEVRVFCVNEGEKTALNYFWHLALPKESLGGHNFKGPANSTIHMADDLFLDGIAFTRVVGTVPTPLFPTRLARVATFHAHASSKRVLCMTVSEDGSYPTENMSDLEICNSFDPLAEDT